MNTKLKKKTIPESLTQREKFLLNRHWYMPKDHFSLLRRNCTEISSSFLRWAGRDEPVYITLYGLGGVRVESGERTIANFFIYHDFIAYQASNLEMAVEIIDAIKKSERIDEYRKKIERLREKERAKKQSKTPAEIKKAA